MKRAHLATLVLLLASGACSKTPPEPEPAATITRADPAPRTTAASPNAGGSRCIAATPSVAPPIPAAAPAAACPPDPEPNQKLPVAEVTFPDAAPPDGGAKGGTTRVVAELVKAPSEIERGLMYRRSMPEDHGMLFRLDGRREHMFWMHNTCIPLDMLFVDEDGTIVGIVEGAEPLTDTTRSVGCPSLYVLEVNAGYCRKHGVRAGQKITIPDAAR